MNNRSLDAEQRRLPEHEKITNKQNYKTTLFFRCPVAVHLSITTKLCMQTEGVSTIFATGNYFWIRSLVFALGAKNTLLGFLVPKFFFVKIRHL